MRRADIEVPNRFVAVNAWKRLACYPQGSFYPLSHGPSMRYRKITKPDFRPCSTCLSRSQAPFCLYALRMISNHSEGTFGRLRYSLGGDRPSQTAHLTLFPVIHLRGLDIRCTKSGIPRLTPPRLAS
jgi:hypothetical protein